MRIIALCCTIAALVVTVALWIKKSRQAVRGNQDHDAAKQRKRMVKFYGSAVGLLICYCVLILAFDGPTFGTAAMVVSEIWLLRQAIMI